MTDATESKQIFQSKLSEMLQGILERNPNDVSVGAGGVSVADSAEANGTLTTLYSRSKLLRRFIHLVAAYRILCIWGRNRWQTHTV